MKIFYKSVLCKKDKVPTLIYLLYTIYLLIKQPTNVFTIEEGKLYKEETDIGYVIRNEKVVKGEKYKNGISYHAISKSLNERNITVSSVWVGLMTIVSVKAKAHCIKITDNNIKHILDVSK